ncbi:hypothetical protein MKX01_008703 [Papaver californicum]|nr:hypothetical protein MKX01_008703 [Papaver californicum]
MQSQMLPITLPSPTMLFRTENGDDVDDEQQSHLLLSSSSSSSSLSSIKDDKKMPFLSRALSYTHLAHLISNKKKHKRRRGISSDDNIPSLSRQQSTLTQEVAHAASETYLITISGYRWITKFVALGCYAMLLMPGFIQAGFYYYRSRQVRRGIVYGDQLDLYLPENADGPMPVVAFITGGAWIIGYKAWGSLLGQELAERGVIVACIDYRNFPQGTMSDMVRDASEGISFVCNNIADYGGDPNRIYLMGQSAGAHIAACTLLAQAIKELGEGDKTSWSVSQIKAYFGLSGGYDSFRLVDYFHERGLYRSIFLSIMEGDRSLRRFSPEVRVQDPSIRSAVQLLPLIVLFHGTGDYSIPCDASKTFVDALQRVGVQAELILYEGKTHTDVFLQDPMRGGKDDLFEDILSYIHAGDSAALAKDAVASPRRRLVPEIMLKLAHKVSPF